ncbi:phosphoribosylglycinamide formyltransferase [Thalassospiraceae bacterium LMO-JJ14]|nr:phosphoribosylglycinamide formyltransferase [Thalassospiraceae bacterium LMO-JJ14]
MARMKIAVLVSGRGSNMQAILDASADNQFPAEVAVVISNIEGAPALARAEAAGVRTATVRHKDFPDRESFDRRVSEEIKSAGCELVVLAGFMRLLSEEFCETWRDRLINIHPSLLPSFKGLDVHARMINAGVRFGGCTVHYVRHEMDTGPIIVQAAVPVHPGDDADTLAARILEQEHIIYPLAVRWIAEGRVRITGEVVRVSGAKAPDGALINYQD